MFGLSILHLHNGTKDKTLPFKLLLANSWVVLNAREGRHVSVNPPCGRAVGLFFKWHWEHLNALACNFTLPPRTGDRLQTIRESYMFPWS